MTRPSLQLRMLTQLSVALVGIGLFSLQAHAQAVFRISAIPDESLLSDPVCFLSPLTFNRS